MRVLDSVRIPTCSNIRTKSYLLRRNDGPHKYFKVGKNIIYYYYKKARRHAVFLTHQQHPCPTYIVDLGSGHGTKLNSNAVTKLTPAVVSHGDRLVFGSSPYIYVYKQYYTPVQLESQYNELFANAGSDNVLDKSVFVNTQLNHYASYRIDKSSTSINSIFQLNHHKRSYRRMSTTAPKHVTFSDQVENAPIT